MQIVCGVLSAPTPTVTHYALLAMYNVLDIFERHLLGSY